MKRSRRCFNLLEVLVIALVLVIGAAMLFPGLQHRGAREKARRINCAGNLKTIGLAMLMYSGEYVDGEPTKWGRSGWFPVSTHVGTVNLGILNDEGYLQDGKVYGCPSFTDVSTIAVASDYAYIGSGLKDDNLDPSENSLAYDLSGNHPDNLWMNVLFIDGHVSGAKPGTQADKFSNNWPVVKRD